MYRCFEVLRQPSSIYLFTEWREDSFTFHKVDYQKRNQSCG